MAADSLKSKAKFQFGKRSAGVLMHITSLPGKHGSGDLGREAFEFVDFLASAGQTWWQILPHNPPGGAPGYSPYSAPSTFAGNWWFVSLDDLVERGYLTRRDLKPLKTFRDDKVVFDDVELYRDAALRRAFANAKSRLPASYNRFVERNASWLADWSLYAALHHYFDRQPWVTWPADIRGRSEKSLAIYREKLAEEIAFHQFVQWLFREQWLKLKNYAAKKGVGLIGDVPIFVGHDSADVWSNPEKFLLDSKGNPKVVSGCPPDAFNKLGQVWNHPHYNWPLHQRENFRWWVDRFAATYELFDAVRIDHFLGFYRLWAIPFGAKNAIKGKWIFTPGQQLFGALKKRLGNLPIIAEDLGTTTAQALQLRDDFNFPGMRVLMFGFNGGWEHLPQNYVRNCVVYTGTHDCDTANGYVESMRKSSSRDASARLYIDNLKMTVGELNGSPAEAMTRFAMTSIADTVIIPTQDILGLGAEARFNLPGTEVDNWHWRMKRGALTPAHAKRLAHLVQVTQRK